MTEQLPGRIEPDHHDGPAEPWHAERDRLDAADAAQRALERGTDSSRLQGWPYTRNGD